LPALVFVLTFIGLLLSWNFCFVGLLARVPDGSKISD
jgi:hypothetical protein